MTEPNGFARITYSVPSRWDGKAVVNLAVHDGLSGEVLVDAEIPADGWIRLMAGGSQTVESFITPRTSHIGKIMQTTSVDLGWSPTRLDVEESERWASLAAVTHDLAGEYDTHEVRRTNQGWTAVYRRWVEPTPELLAERREMLLPGQ